MCKVWSPLLTMAIFPIKWSFVHVFSTASSITGGNTRPRSCLLSTLKGCQPLAPWRPKRVCVKENGSSWSENCSNSLQRKILFGSHHSQTFLGLFRVYFNYLSFTRRKWSVTSVHKWYAQISDGKFRSDRPFIFSPENKRPKITVQPHPNSKMTVKNCKCTLSKFSTREFPLEIFKYPSRRSLSSQPSSSDIQLFLLRVVPHTQRLSS